jgi:hypothetical protein
MSITVTTSGDWRTTEAYLKRLQHNEIFGVLEKYGAKGAAALAAATPSSSGLTASSWTYEVKRSSGYFSIVWRNTNIQDGFPVAVMIQYGHGTGTGGYVAGRDYINPVIRPMFDAMLNELIGEVNRG